MARYARPPFASTAQSTPWDHPANIILLPLDRYKDLYIDPANIIFDV